MAKSAWLMPSQVGTDSEFCNAMVCGSRKSSRLYASATTMADFPSGVKYMLYGSSTAIDAPGLPVFGSIGVSEPLVVPSALLVTQSVFRSQDGTMCWGLIPTGKVSTICMVAGSMTDTVLAARLGTYTRDNAPWTALLS